jgi:hypothetical protein
LAIQIILYQEGEVLLAEGEAPPPEQQQPLLDYGLLLRTQLCGPAQLLSEILSSIVVLGTP